MFEIFFFVSYFVVLIYVTFVFKEDSRVSLKIKKLHPDAVIPKYATSGSAGFDLAAIEGVFLPSGETRLIKTGLAFQIPEGFELQVRPRSGLSLKTGLRVANAPGTVDQDFIGELCVIMTNTSEVSLNIGTGDRIAQAVLCPVYQAKFEEVPELTKTERGSNGFGSSGK